MMENDPWDWGPASVELFFRSDAKNYISDLRHNGLPPMDQFTAALRKNNVDGPTLLESLDSAALKDDCGVASLGTRNVVLHCIKQLRRESAKYHSFQEHAPPPTSTPRSITQPELVAPASSFAQQSGQHRFDSPNGAFEDGLISPNLSSHGHGFHRLDRSVETGPATERDTRRETLVHSTGNHSTKKGKRLRNGGLQTRSFPERISYRSYAKKPYFTTSAQPVDELFYPPLIQPGDTIGSFPLAKVENRLVVLKADQDAGLEDENFQFVGASKPQGESSYVYRQMLHFMNNVEEVAMERDGRTAICFFPYRDSVARSTRFATLIRFREIDNEPIAIKKNATELGEQDENENEAKLAEDGPFRMDIGDNNEWDFLLHKHRTSQDRELPALGESESGYLEDSELDDSEIGAQAVEENVEGILDNGQAAEIVDGWIRDRIEDWQQNVDEKKAWSVWNRIKQSRSLRDAYIESAQLKIKRLNSRLSTMRDSLLESQWRDKKSLLKKCAALDATVEDREEQKWCIEIWKMRQEPTRYVQRSKAGRRLQARPSQRKHSSTKQLESPSSDRFAASPGLVVSENAGVEQKVPTVSLVDQDITIQDADDEEMRRQAEEEFHTPINSPPFVVDGDKDADAVADEDEQEDPDISPGATANAVAKVDTTAVDSDDDLPSPSTFRVMSRMSKQGRPTDPTKSSDKSSSPRIPGRRRKTPSQTPSQKINNAIDPELAPASEVDKWEYQALREDTDRRRILIKLLRDAGPKMRDDINDCVKSFQHLSEFASHLQEAINFLIDKTLDEKVIPEPIKTTANFYLTYQISQAKPMMCYVRTFSSQLDRLLTKRQSTLFEKSDASNAVVITSSDDGLMPADTPHKKRKKEVIVDMVAKRKRDMAKERENKWDELLGKYQSNSNQLATMLPPDPAGDNVSGIPINPLKEESSILYINSKIGQKMKPHQVDGVRFLWRELTEGDDQGALLAHTMGLGKTMQSIALLAALAEAAQSKHENIQLQLPEHLRPRDVRKRKRQLRMLIICPPSLLQNWRSEIEQWAPNGLKSVHTVENGIARTQVPKLVRWYREGGILLIGYSIFRGFVARRDDERKEEEKTEGCKPPRYPKEVADELDQFLLEGPEVVVADEAHNFKNIYSQTSKAVNKIHTESRIALSGTPMSNNVAEIYAVVSWVAPGYLGDAVQFRAKFEEPINQGLFQDSTRSEKIISTKTLKLLHAGIGPKVNRADISVLRGTLKPKVEFVITVPLTPLQTQVYSRYVTALLGDTSRSKASQVAIFGWISLLNLLTSHPRAFRQKLLEPPKPRKKKKGSKSNVQSQAQGPDLDSGDTTPVEAGLIAAPEQEQEDEAEMAESPEEQDTRTLGFSQQMIDAIIEGLTDDVDPSLSIKVSILQEILRLSVIAGDKVLVFSTSIPTLDYLDRLVTEMKLLAYRIDGNVPMPTRTAILEQYHKASFAVLLISTRAGGQGLNIQGANRVVIFDFSWTPMNEEQAVGRAYRLGQPKPVFVYRFVAGGTFETDVYNKQLFKANLVSRVVDKKNPRRSAERNTRAYLYEPKPVCQESLSQWLGKDPLVMDKLIQAQDDIGGVDTGIRALETMETLQADVLDAPMSLEDEEDLKQSIFAFQNEQRMSVRRGNTNPAAINGVSAPGVPPGIAPQAIAPPPSTAFPGQAPNSAMATAYGPRPAYGPPPPSTMPLPAANRPEVDDPLSTAGLPMSRLQQWPR